MGKVPALKDGEATLAEAAAICAYVAERYPEAKLAPPLGDPLRAKYLYWLFFGPGCIEPAMVQIATKIEMNPVAAGWGDAQRVFDVLDDALQKGPWILGENFSAADIVIGSGLNFAVRLFKMVPSRPSFDAYIDALHGAPGVPARGEDCGGVAWHRSRLQSQKTGPATGPFPLVVTIRPNYSAFSSSGRGIEMTL